MYLKCATNNKSLTVMKSFEQAENEYSVSNRIRSDEKGENMLVCKFMVTARGTGRNGHIATVALEVA